MIGLGAMLIPQVYAQSPAPQIEPPFGLYWGESQKAIERVMNQAQAKIVGRESISGREAWTVEGLVQPELKRTIVYFGATKDLVEVELQYEQPKWDLVAYEEFLNSARKRL